MLRLNKYLADCGIASRRACDNLIKEGKVKVNNKTVTDLSTVVNEENDTVFFEGRRVLPISRKYYVMVHKPKGFVTTVKDELGRKTVMDLVDIRARLFPVGRLDYDSEGLILLTNDGELANLLTHPKNQVPKTYSVRVSGAVSEADLNSLRNGVVVDGKKTSKASVKITEVVRVGDSEKNDTSSALMKNPMPHNYGEIESTKLEITVTEGRNHQIKKMLACVGKEVSFLKRTAIGDLRLGGLSRGTYRHLTDKEIRLLTNSSYAVMQKNIKE